MEGCMDRQRDDKRLHGLIEGRINQWRAVDQWRAVWTDRGRQKVAWTVRRPNKPMEGCVDQ